MIIWVLQHDATFRGVNIWDDIQTLGATKAVEDLWFKIIYIDRENPNIDEEKINCILMQGWMMHNPENFMKFAQKPCIFFGIHFSTGLKKKIKNSPLCQDFLRKSAPIGCRDKDTLKFIQFLWIDGYFSGCLSTIQPINTTTSKKDSIFLVDCDFLWQPLWCIFQTWNLEIFSHTIWWSWLNERFYKTEKLLNKYSKEAKLVITTKLHCALPCLALNIPVIFIRTEKKDRRLDLVKEYTPYVYYIPKLNRIIPLKIRYWILKKFFIKKINWEPITIGISDKIQKTLDLLKKALIWFQK